MGLVEGLAASGIVGGSFALLLHIVKAFTVLRAMKGCDAKDRPEIIRAMGEHWRLRK